MKVQELKKECLANVGLSVEFSNSEIDSIVQLVHSMDVSIEKNYNDLKGSIEHARVIDSELRQEDKGAMGNLTIDPEKATGTIDLKTLVRCRYLLNKITNNRAHDPSSLFHECDDEYMDKVTKINNQ